MDYKNLCENCKTSFHCCIFKDKDSFAFVGIKDAKEIKKNLKLGYRDFLVFRKLPKKLIRELKESKKDTEDHLRFRELNKDKILCLKLNKDKTCIFLDKNRHCMIYEFRPNICKIYPFWVSKNKKVVEHEADDTCKILVSHKKKNKNIEKSLSNREVRRIKKVHSDIIKEEKNYNKNIKEFIKKCYT